ncbi:transglycosylase family protein, partial [Georgenia sp. 10Sc9-8]|nr:transglycosylase family protein [Georgenia halotolerans]
VRRGDAYHLKNSLTAGSADRAFSYGRADDTTLVGDWDGDGVDTLGVRRPPATPAQPAATSNPVTGVWADLARCESGGDPTIVSANGLYYGLYQFSLATWRSVGGSGLPSQASVAEQTERAKILQARSGWGQWPHCAARLGLL